MSKQWCNISLNSSSKGRSFKSSMGIVVPANNDHNYSKLLKCNFHSYYCNWIFSQLFEKLKLQEDAGGDVAATKPTAQGETSKHQPANPEKTAKTPSAPPIKTEKASTLSGTVQTKQDKHDMSLQAQVLAKDCRSYGKVHTRHINQLFIRGENILLVNPQPL